ncbi:hypothetical protein B0H17DRAFT_1140612 [Mycena rosella]|uniref:Uncharacterized protein n=1 Tax=Mycena rosella TaxID=1033263 RepID=A0AAD7G9Y2_MYCRO|nr:hypothetical protein B0H17DRAFT_1140612 [Mycena rosella]
MYTERRRATTKHIRDEMNAGRGTLTSSRIGSWMSPSKKKKEFTIGIACEWRESESGGRENTCICKRMQNADVYAHSCLAQPASRGESGRLGRFEMRRDKASNVSPCTRHAGNGRIVSLLLKTAAGWRPRRGCSQGGMTARKEKTDGGSTLILRVWDIHLNECLLALAPHDAVLDTEDEKGRDREGKEGRTRTVVQRNSSPKKKKTASSASNAVTPLAQARRTNTMFLQGWEGRLDWVQESERRDDDKRGNGEEKEETKETRDGLITTQAPSIRVVGRGGDEGRNGGDKKGGGEAKPGKG